MFRCYYAFSETGAETGCPRGGRAKTPAMDNGFLKLARLLSEDADPSVAAAHSFLNYHAKGVTYLNLLRTPDLTAKLYVFDGSHRPTPEGYVVNPHTHAYGFHSTVVLGTMENVVFEHSDAWGDR